MKSLPLLILAAIFSWPLFTQTGKSISLQECYNLAISQYPIQRQKALIQQISTLNLEKIIAQKLPKIEWNASASLQTETVGLPFEIPGTDGVNLPLYRFQTSLDASYNWYNGGMTTAKELIEKAQLKTNEQAIEVELEKLKSQVNQYFFGIIIQRASIKVLENSLSNIQAKLNQLEAGVRQGITLESELDKLKVESLRLQAQIEEVKGTQKALIAGLGTLVKQPLSDDINLVKPSLNNFGFPLNLQRPELQLFDLEKEKILAKEAIITAQRKPRLGAFAQLGLGLPNPLNFFDDQLSPFGIIGLRFSWNIIDWNQSDRDRQLLSLQHQLVETQRATFEENIRIQETKIAEEISSLNQQIQRAEEIAALQQKILLQVAAQFDHGVITAAEYIDQVKAENQAQLTLQLNLLKLEKIKIDYLTLKGQL